MLIISALLGIGLIVSCCVISFRVGYSSGLQDGKYERDIQIAEALRQIRSDMAD
jgi:hypothetical protein